MWTCPKCGREFKRANQGHYCGTAPATIDEYIQAQSPETQAHLTELANLLRKNSHGVTEQISWSMPFFKKGGRSLSFAACKKHISFYIESDVLEDFLPELEGFTIKKNAVYLPYDKPLPSAVIEAIAHKCFFTES